jgi:lipopolysaccharide exporter
MGYCYPQKQQIRKYLLIILSTIMVQKRNKSFVYDILKLGSGTTLSQLILIAAMPILSRLYPVSLFGTTALFISLITIISSISGFRYEMAILLPKENNEGFHLFTIASIFTLVVGALVGAVIGFNRFLISDILNDPSLIKYLWLAGPGIIFFGMANVFNIWITRRTKYLLLAKAKALSSSLSIVIQIISGLLGLISAGSLIVGNLFGKFLENLLLFKTTIKDIQIYRKTKIDFAVYKKALLRFKKFPLFNTWSTLLNTLSWMMPAFLLSHFFSLQIVGFYAVGDRVIRTPMNVIGRAISQVFFQRGAESFRDGNLGELFLNTIQMLTRIGLLPTMALSLIGRDLFIIILGAKWAEAGFYTQILALWGFVWFISSPISTIMSIVEKQEKALIFNIVNLLTRILSLCVGGFFNSPRFALLLYAGSGIIVYGWLLLWAGQLSGVKWYKTIRAILLAELKLVLPAGILIALVALFIQSHLLVVILVTLIIASYYGLLYKKYGYILFNREKGAL